jgi:hypothetical protein
LPWDNDITIGIICSGVCERLPIYRGIPTPIDDIRRLFMRAKLFKQATTTAHPPDVTNDYVSEALAKQAALRPPKTPPKLMPITPTLPRVPKPHKHKRLG